MKKILIFIVFISYCLNGMASSPPLKSHINECFELTSIVFRLAGAPEYSTCEISRYVNDIDNYFAPYKGHKLIQFAKEIRDKHGISYNAIASVAANINLKNEEIILNPDIDFSEVTAIIDYRWTPEIFKTFLSLLNDFYKETHFNKFYINHANLYHIAEINLDLLLERIDIEWFKSVFTEKVETPTVIVSLCNGASNYAVTTPNKKVIVIGSGVDLHGMPYFNKNKISIILHEFLHHYTNPLIYNYW